MSTTYTEHQFDILNELGSIGTGNTIIALSKLLNNSISFNVPYVRMLDYEVVLAKLGGSDQLVSGLMLTLHDDIEGMILLLLQEEFTKQCLEILVHKRYENLLELDEFAQSALREMSNIMASSYVNAISSLTNSKITVSVPDLCIDMLGSILSVPAITFGAISNSILFIENDFAIEKQSLNSSILLFAKDESINTLINRLGLAKK